MRDLTKPKPERRSVYLPSMGYTELVEDVDGNKVETPMHATLHVYHDTVLEDDPKLGGLAPQWAFMFRCTETGFVRKHGVQDARHINPALISEGN